MHASSFRTVRYSEVTEGNNPYLLWSKLLLRVMMYTALTLRQLIDGMQIFIQVNLAPSISIAEVILSAA